MHSWCAIRLNTTYLTGYWHTTTERPEATFMNHDDADPWFMYPALDRDLVRTWWFGSGKTYFDFKDDGSFPNEGKVAQGKTVDLFRFLLEGIKEHGIQGKKIGIDGELYPSESAKAREILPDVEWVNVDPILMDMRIVKTPEELALWRRAYVYFDRAHAFARDYILTHGTDITDYEVKMATELWINQSALFRSQAGQRHTPSRSQDQRGAGSAGRSGDCLSASQPALLQPHWTRHGAAGFRRRERRRLRRRKLPHVHYCRQGGRVRSAHAQALGSESALLRHAGGVAE